MLCPGVGTVGKSSNGPPFGATAAVSFRVTYLLYAGSLHCWHRASGSARPTITSSWKPLKLPGGPTGGSFQERFVGQCATVIDSQWKDKENGKLR